MDRLQFFMPVRIVTAPDQPVTEIYSVEQALTFLQNWPVGQQSPIFQRTLNSCFGATVDQDTVEDARKALVGFARVAGILARDMPIPLLNTEDWLKPSVE